MNQTEKTNEREYEAVMPDHKELAKTILRFMDETASNPELLDRGHLERSIAASR